MLCDAGRVTGYRLSAPDALLYHLAPTRSGLLREGDLITLRQTGGQSISPTRLGEPITLAVQGTDLADPRGCCFAKQRLPGPEACGQTVVPLVGDASVIPSPPLAAQRLDLVKTLARACSSSESAQRHDCTFDLVLRNSGEASFVGVVALTDTFMGLQPTAISTQGEGWSCHQRGAEAICINGAVQLAPGHESHVQITLSLRGGARPVRFENCAALGVGPDRAVQAMVAQRAMQLLGIDGGPVDGQPGPRTRAGLRVLTEMLGLAVDENITSELFTALGLPEAGPVSCVSVDLPALRRPTPPPPPVCTAPNTVRQGNACVCRRGFEQVAGRGCVPRTDPPPPTVLQCDGATTINQGDACVCRFPGMVRHNATSCVCPQGTTFSAGQGCITPQVEPILCPNGLPRLPHVGCIDVRIEVGPRFGRE
ncbi:hypothetical protein BD293_4358 [Roseinatronobacter monicus]|uniref:Peptidoglycan binding protein n=1 Tax=Roseinatronobacter monicus TaxID=393481 RepID=A0A543K3L6_9RHOB|nr:hypothetical protein BD293_4358 [Roseinatronobacter monicus]